ncbi:MAG: nucleoside-diphosphate kinase [Patescibacteria group bacterium]
MTNQLQRTLVLLKPDALDRGIVGEILTRFERVGAKMIGMKLLVSKKDTAEKHYREDIAERYGQEIRTMMIDMLLSGPVVAMVWEGVEIIEVVRKMIGATYPNLALPGTVRGDYAHVSKDYANEKKIGVFNLVHASSNPEEAKMEIEVWFKPEELVSHQPGYTKMTLRE